MSVTSELLILACEIFCIEVCTRANLEQQATLKWSAPIPLRNGRYYSPNAFGVVTVFKVNELWERMHIILSDATEVYLGTLSM